MRAAQTRSVQLLILLITLACAGVSHARAADATPTSGRALATFAGGCFWCMQPPFEHLAGVAATTVGYTGGHTQNPTYEEVSAGGPATRSRFRSSTTRRRSATSKLLDVFWHNVDPLTPNAQFCDHGNQYRTAIFYHDETQRRLAEESKQHLEAIEALRPSHCHADRARRPTSTRPRTIIRCITQKNPVRYKYYRWNCGRDQRLKEVWGEAAGHMEEE